MKEHNKKKAGNVVNPIKEKKKGEGVKKKDNNFISTIYLFSKWIFFNKMKNNKAKINSIFTYLIVFW